MLEDELQRIKLVGDFIDVHSIVTGVVCAFLGIFSQNVLIILNNAVTTKLGKMPVSCLNDYKKNSFTKSPLCFM